MNFGNQSKNFESMSMYIYNYWDNKQYTDILSITYLNFLCGFEENLGNACRVLHHK